MGEGLPTWLQVIYGALVPLIVGMLVLTYQQRQAHKAAAPRESAEQEALETRVQGETLDRIAKENERLSARIEALAVKADKAQERADNAQAAAELAKEVGRQQGLAIKELERRQESAVKFIAHLITTWPQPVAPEIPPELAPDVDPHLKRPKES